MRLLVQILAADRAEARAVGRVEDLAGKRQRERVARPRGEIDGFVDDIGRDELLVARGVRGVVLARVDRLVDRRVRETPEARAVQARAKRKLVDVPGRRLGDRELRGHAVRHGQVLLPAQHERLELYLDGVAELLAGAKLRLTQIERRHASTVAGTLGLLSRAGARRASRESARISL